MYVPSGRAVASTAVHAVPVRVTLSSRTGDPEVPVPANTSTVTVAESPARSPAEPENAGVESLLRDPSAGDVSVTAGAARAIVNVRVLLTAALPTSSDCRARTVYVPSSRASAAASSSVQPDPDRVTPTERTGVPDGLSPAKISIVTVVESPVALPAVPAKLGVVSVVDAPSPGTVTVTAGAVVSTTNVLGALTPSGPSVCVWRARAVYVPSASAVASTAVHPVPVRVTLSSRTGVPEVPVPANTSTVTVAESPARSLAEPENAGVESLLRDPSAGAVSVTAGAARRIVNVRVTDTPGPLPRSSYCSAGRCRSRARGPAGRPRPP